MGKNYLFFWGIFVPLKKKKHNIVACIETN